MHRIIDIFPGAQQARARRARQSAQRRRTQDESAARSAESAARYATYRLLGAEAAFRSHWRGQGDGSATGVVSGMTLTWLPPAPGSTAWGSGTPGAGGLYLHRSCHRCTRRWATPARSADHLLASAAAVAWCGCGGTSRLGPAA